jgi:hypothetical protein
VKILSLRAYTHSLSTKTESQKPDLAGLSARQSTDTNAILSVRAHVPSLPQKVKDQKKSIHTGTSQSWRTRDPHSHKKSKTKKNKKNIPKPLPPRARAGHDQLAISQDGRHQSHSRHRNPRCTCHAAGVCVERSPTSPCTPLHLFSPYISLVSPYISLHTHAFTLSQTHITTSKGDVRTFLWTIEQVLPYFRVSKAFVFRKRDSARSARVRVMM